MSDNMEIRFGETVRLELGHTIPVPVRDYLLMINKPQINGHELVGNFVIRVGDLENDAGYLQTETDPTVPGWAKEPQKPTYTAEEVHALPDTTFIPSKESDLEHDRGYYIKPIDGIPLADLQLGLIPTKVSQLENDSRFYVKPVGGIPASDIDAALIRLLNGKMNSSLKGAPNGVAELDRNGMVPSHQLPSYVDDVKSYTSIAFFPAVGEDDKIYVDKSTNLQYRWGGTDVGYITIGTSLALGETTNTAYRGDRGKAAYDHAMAKGQAYSSGLYKIVTNSEGHVIGAELVTKNDIIALGFDDPSDKADKADTILETTLSRGRRSGTEVGVASFAFGNNVEASGYCADATGNGTDASGDFSHAEGRFTTAYSDASHAEGSSTRAIANYAHSEGLGALASGEAAHAEGAGTQATGMDSHAEGGGTRAIGAYAHAEGAGTTAEGSYSHSEGTGTQAIGSCAHAEGAGTQATGMNSHSEGGRAQATGAYTHAEGAGTLANGPFSHVEGADTIAAGSYSHVSGLYNIEDTYDNINWPEWTPGEHCIPGDKRRRIQMVDEHVVVTGYICKTENSDANWDDTHWTNQQGKMNYLVIVGNGTGDNARSNAYSLDWDGNGHFAGDVYIGCNPDGTGGVKLDAPAVDDVRINGSSILQNGIANIPVGNGSTYGVYKVGQGLLVNMGALEVQSAGNSNIKDGTADCYPIVPYRQHTSVFYGLSKLAGEDLKNATVTVGTYPDASKQAIQKLFGLDGILGDFENSAVASKAYAIGETFIYNGKRYRATAAIAISDVITPGTNCELEPLNLAYIPKNAIDEYSGLYVKSNGKIAILASDTNVIKAGANNSRPITAYTAKDAAFYGLAKAANDSTQVSSSNPVGTYTTEAKTAIQTMLGIEADIPLIEEVSGSTPSITGMPNVRYICGTCSLLTITPPASGSIVVRFTSGSTPTVLTVPNTVKFPVWFDYTSLEADTTYEIIITDGVYGGVMSWAA